MTNATGTRAPVIDADVCERANETMAFVSRRWVSAVLRAAQCGARRFVTYRHAVDGISDRMLSQRLRELEERGLIHREVIPTTPVQVRYDLTDRGRSLIEAVDSMTQWAHGQD